MAAMNPAYCRTHRLPGVGFALLAASLLPACSEEWPTIEPVVRVQSVRILPDAGTLQVGDVFRFTAEVRDQRGNLLTDRSVRWQSSDAQVAVVDSSGTARGMRVGSAWISASVGPHFASAAIRVVLPYSERPYAVQLLPGYTTISNTPPALLPNGSVADAPGFGISPAGVVVGSARQEAHLGTHVPVRWSDTTPTPLIPLSRCPAGRPCSGAALAMNAAGDIVGFLQLSYDGGSAWVWRGGEYSELPAPAGGGAAVAINDRGEIAGFMRAEEGLNNDRAVLWRDEQVIELGALGGPESRALGINDNSVVVGWARVAAPPAAARRAFLWRNGTQIDLGTFGAPESVAYAINAHDQVVGWYGNVNYPRGFVWAQGTATGLEGSPVSIAVAINDRGDIVGVANPDGRGPRGVLWRDGRMYDLNDLVQDPSVVILEAKAINNAGQIVAIGRAHDDVEQHALRYAFLLTPSPGW